MKELIEMILEKFLQLTDKLPTLNTKTVELVVMIFFALAMLSLQLIICYNLHGGA